MISSKPNGERTLLKLLVSYPLAIFENSFGLTLTEHKFSFKKWYPCRDSNPGTRFRKPLLYPPELQGLEAKLWISNDFMSAFGVKMALTVLFTLFSPVGNTSSRNAIALLYLPSIIWR